MNVFFMQSSTITQAKASNSMLRGGLRKVSAKIQPG